MRAVLTLVGSLAAIGGGLYLVLGPGWALVAVGALVWLDLFHESCQRQQKAD